MIVEDWSKYKNFTKKEFDCKQTGENRMQVAFMDKLQELRDKYGKSLVITSGFRGAKHSVEAKKAQPGTHNKGIACDIACQSSEAHEIVKIALAIGFTGVGISQKSGLARFIHIDLRETTPVLYSY